MRVSKRRVDSILFLEKKNQDFSSISLSACVESFLDRLQRPKELSTAHISQLSWPKILGADSSSGCRISIAGFDRVSAGAFAPYSSGSGASGWSALEAFLWMKISAQEKAFQVILDRQDVCARACLYNKFAALSWLAWAQMQAGQLKAARESFVQLLSMCEKEPGEDRQGYGQKAILSLAKLLALESSSVDSLAEVLFWNDRAAEQRGRGEEYYCVCLELGRILESKNGRAALRHYGRMVLQATQTTSEMRWLAEALLRKGIVEAQQNLLPESWSSLDLYLRLHATKPGAIEAWPLFLRVTSSLEEHPEALSFHAERFSLVLKRLELFSCDREEKSAWIEELAHRLYENSPKQAESFLLAVKARALFFTPEQELLLAMAQAKLSPAKFLSIEQDQKHFEALLAKARALIASKKMSQSALQRKYLLFLREACSRESAFQRDRLSLEALVEALHNNPSSLSEQELLESVNGIQKSLQARALHLQGLQKPAFEAYFLDPIFDWGSLRYKRGLDLCYQESLLAKKGAEILQNLMQKSENSSSPPPSQYLLLARLQWAANDLRSCSQTLFSLHKFFFEKPFDPELDSLRRPYLTYHYGVSLLLGQIEMALVLSQELFDSMQKEGIPLDKIQIGLARECSAAAEEQKSLSLYEKALEFYRFPLQKEKELELLAVEISIEERLLLCKKVRLLGSSEIPPSLLDLKRDCFELDEENLSKRDPLSKKERGSGYRLLLDALIAQERAVAFCSGSIEEGEQDSLYLLFAQSLYNRLLEEKSSPYLIEQARKGLLQVAHRKARPF